MRDRTASLIAAFLFAPLSAVASDPALGAAARDVARGDCAAADRSVRAYLQDRAAPHPDAYRLLADCYGRTGQTMKSVEVLREGLAALPASTVLQRSLGESLFRQDPKSFEAGDLLRRASDARQGDPEAAHYYAQWAYVNRQDEICVRKEQAALRGPELNDRALLQMYTLLGMCQSRLELAQAARASFRKARTVNLRQPSYDPMAAYQYVLLLNRLGEESEAMLIVDEILQRVPIFAPGLLERAKSLERARKPAEAILAAKAALAGKGNDPDSERAAHGVLARCYFAVGDLAAAEQEQQWIQQHPNPATRR